MPGASDANQGEIVLDIGGMTCASCVRRIERILGRLDGVTGAEVSLAARSARVVMALPDPVALPDPAPLVAAIENAGYQARVRPVRRAAATEWQDYLRRALVAAFCTFYVLVISLALRPTHTTLALAWLFATPVQFYCAAPFLLGARNAARHRTFTMDTLVSLGSLAAYGYSAWVLATGGSVAYFDTAATIVTLILVGKMLEAGARARAGDAVGRLLDREAKEATVVEGRSERRTPIDELRVGDLVRVRPGETVPADGTVTKGTSAIDLSILTGESEPVDVGPGDEVVGAALNGPGPLEVRVTRTGPDTRLARIVRLLERTQASKPPVQRLADRIAAVFVPCVVVLAGLTYAARLLVGLAGTGDALLHAAAVLLVACPCSLGLATPTAIMAGVSRAGDLGILFKGGEAVEAARRIDTVLLDKTGTVTEGRMALTSVVVLGDLDRAGVLALAAGAELGSEHPVGRAVVAAGRAEGLDIPEADDVVAQPGRGVAATVAGRRIRVGRPDGLGPGPDGLGHGPGGGAAAAAAADELARGGQTVLAVWQDDVAIALLGCSDRVKAGSAEAVDQLRRSLYDVAIVSGDRAGAVSAVARQVGVDRVMAEAFPEDKVAEIRRLQAEGRRVAFVGDGLNDAPALAQADLGIAMGTGTDVAMEAAGVMVMNGDLRLAVDALFLARRTYTTIVQNLAWAFAYNVVMIPLAVRGVLAPMVAAGAMAASSVTVVSNALRLRRYGGVRWSEPASAPAPAEAPVLAGVAPAPDGGSAPGVAPAPAPAAVLAGVAGVGPDPELGPWWWRLMLRLEALFLRAWDF
ncbi:MAG TPA: cation-translocating P-type ATPase [Acidimicrobiales bacterium]|nr:cation-translocating P-type ATPase [Acidimicrobiales bacterium]